MFRTLGATLAALALLGLSACESVMPDPMPKNVYLGDDQKLPEVRSAHRADDALYFGELAALGIMFGGIAAVPLPPLAP